MENKNDKPKGKQPNKFARLSGMGVQMGATIFVMAYGGKLLDQKYPAPSGKKWFTLCFVLAGVALSLYNIIIQLNRLNKDD